MNAKKMMSAILTGAMITGMAVSAVPTYAGSDVETITMLTYVDWYGDGLKAVENYINENSEELGFKLEVQQIPGGSEGDQLLAARTTTDDLPDLLNGYSVDRFYLSSGGEGKLVPLDGVESASEYDQDLISSSLYSADDQLYALPFGTAYYYGTYYNKTVLEEAGVSELPKNWDEFLEACEKVKALGKTPLYISGADLWTLSLFPMQAFVEEYAEMDMDATTFWAEVMNTNQKTFAECEYVKDSIEKVKELIDLGYVQDTYLSDSYDMAQTALANGDCAFYNCAHVVVSEIASKYPDKLDDIGGMMTPLMEESENKLSIASPTMLAVTTAAKDPELAKKALDFICSAEAMDIYAAAQPGVYINKNMDAEQAGAIKEQSEYPQSSSWNSTYSDVVSAALTSAMVDYFLGTITLDEVLENVDAEVARSAEAAGDEHWAE